MEDFVEPANLIDCSIFPEIEKWGSSLAATHGWLLGSRGGGVRWWGVVKPPPRVTESALVSLIEWYVMLVLVFGMLCGFLDIIPVS